MADTKKSMIAVDTITTIEDTDSLFVNDSGAVKQITLKNILDKIGSISVENKKLVINTGD